MSTSSIVLHGLSTVVILLLAAGLYYRKRDRVRHWRFMVAAFVTDVLLVVYIEASRGAIDTVMSEVRPLIWFHAAVSVAVLVLYVVLIVLGRRLLRGGEPYRPYHRNTAMAFLTLRGINYVTSFIV